MQVRLCLGLLALTVMLGGCEKTDTRKNTATVEVIMKNVQLALERYHADHGEYPDSLDVLIKGGQLTQQDVVDPWSTPLSYQRPESGKYILKSLGPDKQEGTDDISLKQL
jgi:type II secretory pathway pseudopilin PulG